MVCTNTQKNIKQLNTTLETDSKFITVEEMGISKEDQCRHDKNGHSFQRNYKMKTLSAIYC